MSGDGYGIGQRAGDGEFAAPELPWRGAEIASPVSGIGLVGCGGISGQHLIAYRDAGWPVRALCSRDVEKAEARRSALHPKAVVVPDWTDLVVRDDVGVVDVTTHPPERQPIIEGALRAGKHVLSQKPFVTDLATGIALCDLADACGVRLAVNQNGRWAPHFSWMRHAVAAGLVGDVVAVDVTIHWNHDWVAGTPFDDTPHLLLHDFGVHWFDVVRALMPGQVAGRVTASVMRSPSQRARPPLLGQAAIAFDAGRATITFCGASASHQLDTTLVVGTRGTLRSTGPDLQNQVVTLHTEAGVATPQLEGQWFPDGFRGAMGELLAAVADDRVPSNDARDNLESLRVCWAACAASGEGRAVSPAEVDALPS